MTIKVYISADGDNIGRMVGIAAQHDDESQVRILSSKIKEANKIFADWASFNGGTVIEDAGDEIRVKIDADHLKDLPDLKQRYQDFVGATLSIGIGTKLSEADKALLAAKLRGKDRIVFYDSSVREDLAKLTPKTEEQKLYDEYLGQDYTDRSVSDNDGNPEQRFTKDPFKQPLVKETRAYRTFIHSGQHLEDQDPGKNRGALQAQVEPDSQIPTEDNPQTDNTPQPSLDASPHDELANFANAPSPTNEPQTVDPNQQDNNNDELKKQVVDILKLFQEKKKELEAIHKQDPELYQGLTVMLQSMIAMAREVFGNDTNEQVAKGDIVPLNPLQGPNKQFRAKAKVLDFPNSNSQHNDLFNLSTSPVTEDLPKYEEPIKVASAGPHGKNIYDYSHLLPDNEKNQGFSLHVGHIPGEHDDFALARLMHNNHEVAKGYMYPNGQPRFNISENANKDLLSSIKQGIIAGHKALTNHSNWILANRRLSNPLDKKDLMPGGKGDNKPDSDFNEEQLSNGAKQEQEEHGLDSNRAKEIAKDHLTEDPNYYKSAMNPGATGEHHRKLPVGSQLDTSSNGTKDAGKVKVLDQETNKAKWHEVRSGQIMDSQGNPTSSRNQNS